MTTTPIETAEDKKALYTTIVKSVTLCCVTVVVVAAVLQGVLGPGEIAGILSIGFGGVAGGAATTAYLSR